MNRRGFLGKLGVAIAAVVVEPAINLLAEEKSICHRGLLWQIENSANTFIYDGKITMAMFDELMLALYNQYTEDDEIWFPLTPPEKSFLGLS